MALFLSSHFCLQTKLFIVYMCAYVETQKLVIKCDLSQFVNTCIYILQRNFEMFTFYARLYTEQICSRADCEKSNDRISSTPVSNKTTGISASLKLEHLIVSQLILEIFKNFMKNQNLKKSVLFIYQDMVSHFYHFFPTARISAFFKI